MDDGQILYIIGLANSNGVAIAAVIEACADQETLLHYWVASSNDIDAQDAQDAPVGAGANT
jgi:hypothetical protein